MTESVAPPLAKTRRTWPWVVAVASAGLLLRLGSWATVLQPSVVALVPDSDPHYHVLRAEGMLHGSPGAPWRDPNINWPLGSDIPWPPLFDGLIAGASWAFLGRSALRDDIARVAAFLPVALGLLTLPLLASLTRRLLGGRRGLVAAFLVAVLPAHASFTVLGRADQHSAELLLFVGISLAFAHATLDAGRRVLSWTALALLLATAYWTWQGSALFLVLPVCFTLVWNVAAAPEDPTRVSAAESLAALGLGGAAVLTFTLAAFGPGGALTHPAIAGVNVLAVAVAGGAGTVGAILVAFGHRQRMTTRARRVAQAFIAAALPAALLLGLSSSLRMGSSAGLAALLRGNAWYRDIIEFRPSLLGGSPLLEDLGTLLTSLGLVHLAALAAIPSLIRQWRAQSRRASLAFLVLGTVVFLAAALLRRRFIGYALVAAAPMAEAGIRSCAAFLSAHVGALGARAGRALAACALLVVAPALPADLAGVGPLPNRAATSMETFILARGLTPTPGREVVLTPWPLGHYALYFWDRPVVLTPFGVEGGAGAFEAWAAFFFSTNPRFAEEALLSRRISWVVLDDPSGAADRLLDFAPPGSPRFFDAAASPSTEDAAAPTAAYWSLLPARLYHGDGRQGGPASTHALTGFRLVLESPPPVDDPPGTPPQLKIFQVVAGARVAVTADARSGTVEATTTVRTNTGRTFSLSVAEQVDAERRAILRLPYASGANGFVWAEPWLVTDGRTLTSLALTEADVTDGHQVKLTLRPAAR